ncbi:MAG: tRNA (pseudouridine(54)-N(1))-methyltransferase TrmY [Methanohalobium sp.]|uniref:tRNA (pseudouridine(54)-N(1))-methyltransferase TrmY n=1 Tax=Methanohalobium sp. TaxID=2837493 RepID=UPI00397DDC47
MRDFIVIGHKASTSSDFSLNDLPGSAGRMDILCRCINSAFFLSHDIRTDVQVHLLLLGQPEPGKIIRFNGENIKHLNPDERSSGALIKKALEKNVSDVETQSTPGVWIRKGNLKTLLDGFKNESRTLAYLREGGEDIREIAGSLNDAVFILGDHLGVTDEEEEIILNTNAKLISVSPHSIHADHCILILNNELDRALEK